jgi:protein-arginine kinase activator protein McsA
MRESEIKNQITMEKAKLDMEIKQAKFEQDQAIKDAENAMKLREQS